MLNSCAIRWNFNKLRFKFFEIAVYCPREFIHLARHQLPWCIAPISYAEDIIGYLKKANSFFQKKLSAFLFKICVRQTNRHNIVTELSSHFLSRLKQNAY